MKPVVQQDRTGCGIASVAAVVGESYTTVKKVAGSLGIHVEDPRLWSDTRYVRELLAFFDVASSDEEEPFTTWSELPARALLAIKWHEEKGRAAWHWVVFVRKENLSYVLDPKRALRTNRRMDFGRMKPKWFIALPTGANQSLSIAGEQDHVSQPTPDDVAQR